MCAVSSSCACTSSIVECPFSHSPAISLGTRSANPYVSAKTTAQSCHHSRIPAQTNILPFNLEKLPAVLPELKDEEIVSCLSQDMDSRAAEKTENSDMPSGEDDISVFFSVSKPEIETVDYMKRLVQYSECSKTAFIVVLVYLRRLEESNSQLGITYYNMHRLLITALMLAAKILDDRCYSNAHYARVGGIASVKEMNRLEIQMLKLLDYQLVVAPEVYVQVVQDVKERFIAQSPTAINPAPEISFLYQPSTSQLARSQLQHHQSYCPHGHAFSSIHVSSGLADHAFNQHSENDILAGTALSAAVKFLGIPLSGFKDRHTFCETPGAISMNRAQFLSLIPSILASAAFSRADLSDSGSLDVNGFRSALQSLGLNMEYYHLFRYFGKADAYKNGSIDCHDFITILPIIAHERNISFDHMVMQLRSVLEDKSEPVCGFFEVSCQMAVTAFTRADSSNRGYLDMATFQTALQHLNINVERNRHKVVKCFGTADKNHNGHISKEEFLAIFASATMEASKNVHQIITYRCSSDSGLIGVAARATPHSQHPQYHVGNTADRLEASDRECHVLSLNEGEPSDERILQYNCAGVRPRVYR